MLIIAINRSQGTIGDFIIDILMFTIVHIKCSVNNDPEMLPCQASWVERLAVIQP